MADWTPLFVALPLAAAFLCLLLKSVAPRAAPWITVLDMMAVLGLGLAATLGGTDGVSFLGGWGPESAAGTRFVSGIAVVLDGLSVLFLRDGRAEVRPAEDLAGLSAETKRQVLAGGAMGFYGLH